MPDIRPLSVNLPVMSTVNLPKAQLVSSGYSTGMDQTKLILGKIDRFLRIEKTNDHALGKLAGSPDAIRNLRRYAAGQIKGVWTLDTLEAVARAMGTTSWELLRPPGAIPQDEEFREYVREIVREEQVPAMDTTPRRRRR